MEAARLGLVDELGDLETVKAYLREVYGLEEVEFIRYEHAPSFLEALTGRVQMLMYALGQGIGNTLGFSLTSAPEMVQKKWLLI